MAAWKHLRGMEHVSLCDWPGRIACVLFFGGCNLRCPTCHNAGLAWHKELFPVIPRDDVLDYLSRRKSWLEGITITGGEPTLVPDLPNFLAELKTLGLAVKMDTNGQRPDVVRDLLKAGLVDVFAVDVKGPWHKYPDLTGGMAQPERAEENLNHIFDLARQFKEAFYFRTTFVPALTERDIKAVRRVLPPGFDLTLQPYVIPGGIYAQTDSKEGRLPGDLVPGPDSERRVQGLKGQRHQGSAPL